MKAYIAFGGNLGNVRATFDAALDQIAALPTTTITDRSRLYCTPPIGPAGQPDYLNSAIAIETKLKPHELLTALQQIELDHGRERHEHWGARTLDLDIIAIDDQIIESATLSIPHALMHSRQFVLRPLCDLAPEWQHPALKKTAAELLDSVLAAGERPIQEGEIWSH